MLAADIGKAIDSGGGKTQIATLGGGTLTATRSGDAIVIADAAGTTAPRDRRRQRPVQWRDPPHRRRAVAGKIDRIGG